MKVNFYTVIHKAIRRNLYLVAIEIGNHDFSNTKQFPALQNKILDVLQLLSDHAKHEETFIRPLLEAKLPDMALRLGDEHASHLEEINQLVNACHNITNNDEGLAFYRAYNQMAAESVLHMEQEEATMEVLQTVCTEEELFAVHMEIIKHFTPEKMLQCLDYMMPAMNLTERANMAKGMLMNAADDSVKIILDKIKTVLPVNDWLALKAVI